MATGDLPDHDRPRERAARLGMTSLSDRELLAALLGTGGVRGRTVSDLAGAVLAEHGSLSRMSTASIADLARVHGIGLAKAAILCAAFEVGRRAREDQSAALRLESSARIAAAAAPALSGRHESLLVLSADSGLRLHGIDVVSQGGACSASVPVREVLSAVLRRDCTAFALAHQHPGGDPTPSPADLAATRTVREAAAVAGLRLLDHVVVADDQWRSVSSASRTLG